MARENMRVAIIDNSLDPSVYRPVDHWRTFLGVPWEAFRASENCFPELDQSYTHLILTGSEASILDRESWVYDELEVIKEALRREIPILGSCYGHQLLALALSGPAHVRRSPQPELGWIKIKIERKGGLLGDASEAYTFSSHFDEVINLDSHFLVLASTPACPIQAFKLRAQPVCGVQFHPEIGISAAKEFFEGRIRTGVETAPLYKKALRMRPRDSGLVRTILRNFLASGEKS
jgi:GMP synthase-like glutamine amidotransferase